MTPLAMDRYTGRHRMAQILEGNREAVQESWHNRHRPFTRQLIRNAIRHIREARRLLQ